jgi:Fe/S biogenesis protein NfuA
MFWNKKEPPMGDLTQEEMTTRIQKILDEMINPAVSSHGGFVELLEVKGNIAYLKLGGGCQGCGMVNVTLKQGIETTLKEEIPQLAGVIDQTDHAGGSNPYYQPSK